ncbi:hypothetical protein MRB53_031654 [Persea americana]|uniref:Uncharacterized protein n=1 Tax=Persea americana TaxID=3435 RepID=A0ACC2KQ28_PERAE|nr:hypothetical protein MRB53_031654 [Persea americana]
MLPTSPNSLINLPNKPASQFQNPHLSILSLPEICQNTKEIQQIHAQIIKRGLSNNPKYPTKLLMYYALPPNSNLQIATTLFNQIRYPDSFTWNTMIRGFSHSNTPEEAIILFYEMTHYPFLPDNHTFPFVIKACTRLHALEEGKQVHSCLVKLGLLSDPFVTNTLIDFYAKCACLEDAHRVFDRIVVPDTVAWNTIINGYVEGGELDAAHYLFDEMPCRDEISWNTMIDGYARNGKMDMAYGLFRKMPMKDVVSWNCLMAGYVKLGDVERALEIFNRMPSRNVVSWTTVILGCVQCGCFDEGLNLFREMQAQNVRANRVTLLSILPAVAHLGALSLGDWILAYIEKNGISLDDSLGSALIDMYSQCGGVGRALHVFQKIQNRGLYSWNSMILALADSGQACSAIDLFSLMLVAKLRPNDVTFIGLLKACSHAGLVEEGCKYFDLMSSVYSLSPQINHYGCMVDLLGRAGLLQEAEVFIQKMPMKPNAIIWNALLSACRCHNNVDIAERAAKHLIELEPNDSAPFVLMSNIYASYDRWNDVDRMRKMMNDQGVRKFPGYSSIEVNGEVYEFLAGDSN